MTGLRVARQTEQALAYFVSLHLAGTAGDGQAAAAQKPERPLGGGPFGSRSLGAEEFDAKLMHALVMLDAKELAHA